MTEPRRLTDPDVLKALTHPLRRRIFRLLREQGPAMVTSLAERAGADPGQISYHLRELAKRGFIEEAPELARDRREHWWRAATGSYGWSSTDFEDPAGRAVAETAERLQIEESFERLRAYHSVRPAWSREWLDAATAGTSGMRLTPEELSALSRELGEVLWRWAEVGRVDPKLRPEERPQDGREHVFLFYHAFPEQS
ncbi:helix-turn-helix transcriptional regulator [Actinospica durhamensis]|uniref:Helix-turn-helix transcriptional regulator n=1 Tax=Actinospica durhamensis TaxID=1508375 RepID=A0A941ENY2_9ACTN|nr:helix-turn-helix domain-containing protein [Actinospica durhamensis]MBR7834428.1 helix-turn-helix transcriptional regulator [Actinospica durhamensis]